MGLILVIGAIVIGVLTINSLGGSDQPYQKHIAFHGQGRSAER